MRFYLTAVSLLALLWPALCVADLTGEWSGGGGTFYLRQVGNVLYWYGERSVANPAWANVYKGSIQGEIIKGEWMDVPKGKNRGKGLLHLKIIHGGHGLEATQRTGGFSVSRWTRVSPTPAGQITEQKTNRGGSDYKSFDLMQASSALCRGACNAEAKCKAWTYVKPGVQGPKARCWLKKAIPRATSSSCCVSGFKGPAVVIYQHASFRGASRAFVPGKYDMKYLGIGNDVLSSVRVPRGMRVRLYENAGFKGRSKELTSDTAFVGKDWNDRVSSLIVK